MVAESVQECPKHRVNGLTLVVKLKPQKEKRRFKKEKDHRKQANEDVEGDEIQSTGMHRCRGISRKLTLESQGVERQPGPPEQAAGLAQDEEVIIETLSITAMKGREEMVAARIISEGQILVVPEHLIKEEHIQTTVSGMEKQKVRSAFGPLDPEQAKTAGGVGILSPHQCPPLPLAHEGNGYKDAVEIGRLAAYWINMHSETYLIFLRSVDGPQEVLSRRSATGQMIYCR